MRNVRAGAIQPNYVFTPPEYYCLGNNYRENCDEIMSNFVEPQLNNTFRLLHDAGQAGLDIVTTCENMAVIGQFIIDDSEHSVFPELVRRSQEIIEEELAHISRTYHMYIIGCYFQWIGDRIYNAASIFGRDGNIVGMYKKAQLPSDEKFQCAEGDSLDVFQLDFGKIGIAICYDMVFPEVTQVLALKGAEIIFHPTAGYGRTDSIGEATLRTRANDNSVYIVTSKNWEPNRAGKSSVIDFWGEVLADADYDKDTFIYADIDLDIEKAQPDWFYTTNTSGIPELRKRVFYERRPELYKIIAEPRDQDILIPDLSRKQEIIDNIRSKRSHW